MPPGNAGWRLMKIRQLLSAEEKLSLRQSKKPASTASKTRLSCGHPKSGSPVYIVEELDVLKRYIGLPLEPPHPAFKNQTTAWLPMLSVRIGIAHDIWSPRFLAVVDSGSPWCIFPTALGDYLGLQVSSGIESELRGIIRTDSEPIYFHKIKIQIEANWNISVMAGFTRKLSADGILGRSGFFDNFLLRFDHSKDPPQLEIDKIERPQ